MQGGESDKTSDHQTESIPGETEENDQSIADAAPSVIEANTNDNRLHKEIEAIEQVITKSDKTEKKKPRTPIKLPNDLELPGPSFNMDVVGDDTSKVKEQDISCECELPKGIGGAVPMVLSLDSGCPEKQSFEGTSANEFIKGDEDKSSCVSTELKSGAESTDNETIIREITAATTSSVIIAPPAKQSTVSNDSVFGINCNTSNENSASISVTTQSLVTDSSFVIEYAIPSLNVTILPTNTNVPDDDYLASLKSLAKKDSFDPKTKNIKSKANNETMTPANSQNATLKLVKTDKNVKKTTLPKISPDMSGSKLVRPPRDLKTSPNPLGNINGGNRHTAPPKDKLPAIKTTAQNPIWNRGNKNVQSTDNVRPYTSSSTYGRYMRKEISSSTQRGILPNARDKMNCRDGESVSKRQSMIPKPRTNVQKARPSSKIDLQRKGTPSDYDLVPKIDPGRRVGHASDTAKRKAIESRSVKDNEELSKSSQSVSDTPPDPVTIHTKMVELQERLKATTTMIKNRMGTNSNPLPDTQGNKDSIRDMPEQTSEPVPPRTASVNLKDLYKNIFKMKETAMRLSDSTTMVSQKELIEKLLMNITEIQRIADKLLDSEASASKAKEPEVSRGKDATIKSDKSKDNKIVIKFAQLKDKQKRKEVGGASNQSDEGCKSTPGTMTDLEAGVIEKVKTEASLRDTDSMDGVFIPSQEPFIHNIEEEEESNGLDITITFPELNDLLSEQNESHLSVRLSDISAEALRKLKRCPKDFTLRMDFVQGKVHFQSGKSPVNNFSIGPDLKFIEYPVDDKKSDIISIKPSTECSYASQLISVENSDEHGASYKSLKSTDSELFNVVDLPFLYRDTTLGTVTRSCMTLRKERMMSIAVIARQFFKSMPQIPSLTYIQEENHLENGVRMTGSRKKEEKWSISKKRDRTQRQQLTMIADEVE